VFQCPQDVDPGCNQTSVVVPGSATPFPVSYGPDRMFVNPAAYGRTQSVALANLDQPADKYLLGDCVTASGFDLDTIACLRCANYNPSRQQNGWSLRRFTAEGRMALPDGQVGELARHRMGSNIVFADGHAKWMRHDQTMQ
jgi:prepilin-type processing-associated H-X9-DG protein